MLLRQTQETVPLLYHMHALGVTALTQLPHFLCDGCDLSFCGFASFPCAFQDTAKLLVLAAFFCSGRTSLLFTYPNASAKTVGQIKLGRLCTASNLLWHFNSSACVQKHSSLFWLYFRNCFCHEALLSLIEQSCSVEGLCLFYPLAFPCLMILVTGFWSNHTFLASSGHPRPSPGRRASKSIVLSILATKRSSFWTCLYLQSDLSSPSAKRGIRVTSISFGCQLQEQGPLS